MYSYFVGITHGYLFFMLKVQINQIIGSIKDDDEEEEKEDGNDGSYLSVTTLIARFNGCEALYTVGFLLCSPFLPPTGYSRLREEEHFSFSGIFPKLANALEKMLFSSRPKHRL